MDIPGESLVQKKYKTNSAPKTQHGVSVHRAPFGSRALEIGVATDFPLWNFSEQHLKAAKSEGAATCSSEGHKKASKLARALLTHSNMWVNLSALQPRRLQPHKLETIVVNALARLSYPLLSFG